MKLAYYITSHGFGHGVRTCAICNFLSPETSVVFRTALPRSFFDKEVHRPFEYDPATFDCGCVQTDGVTVDLEKTIASYQTIDHRNSGCYPREVAWCRNNRIDGIVSDIVPFAFDVARGAGIPSIAVTNFTWYDIYKEYCVAFPGFLPTVEKIKEQYCRAQLLLALSPSLPMTYFKKRKPVGPVGRVGVNIREKLFTSHGISRSQSIGLIYTGNFGMDSISWGRLEAFKGWEFLGLFPLPDSPLNYHRVHKNDFRYQDIISSVDCVIGKVGYGVYAECVLNGAPLIYLPREGFAEYPALDAAIKAWGGGHCLSSDDYYGVAWGNALCGARSRERPRPRQSDGAFRCAQEIEAAIKDP
jgi:hypothetical protein